MKGEKRSIGIGNRVVELFSTATSVTVCRKRSCMATGNCWMISAAATSFVDA